MFSLIKLEWEKNNVKKYVKNAIIMTIILLFIILLTVKDLGIDEKGMVGVTIELFTHMLYIIFSGVMLASFVVNGYKNKTMALMFTYPIKRKKLLLAQMVSVWIFNFIAMLVTKLLAYGMIALESKYTYIDMTGIDFNNSSFYVRITINSIIMVTISFIALLIGMRMKSSKATIVTSVILVCITQGNMGEYTLVNNLLFYCILFIVSFISVLILMYSVEVEDM